MFDNLDDVFGSVAQAAQRSTFRPTTTLDREKEQNPRFGLNAIREALAARSPKAAAGFNKAMGALNTASAMAGAGKAAAAGSPQAVAQALAAQRGWTGADWDALDWIVQRESGWNPNAANPTSSARGLFQKMTSLHGPLEKTIEDQIAWGLNYIAQRYGSPTAAKAFWEKNRWY